MEGDVANKRGIDRGIIGNRPEEKRGGLGYGDVSKGGKVVTFTLSCHLCLNHQLI